MQKSENIRTILIGLITNKEFLKEYTAKFPQPLFSGMLGVSTIEKWCRKYFEKYGEPVNQQIQNAYDSAVRSKRLSPEELEYVERVLSSISEQSDNTEQPPTSFLMDIAVDAANQINLDKLQITIEDCLDKNDVAGSLKAYENFKKVERGEELPKLDFLNDADKLAEYTTAPGAESILIPRPDDAYEKEVFAQIVNSEYTMLKARAKGFKTFAIYNLAIRAILQKKSVLLFSLGDLNAQMSCKRLMGMFLQKPCLEQHSEKHVRVPHIDCFKNKFNTCMNINRTCTKAYMDENGNYNTDYTPCTACSKCNKPFPVCVTHTMEKTGSLITEDDVRQASSAMKRFMGDKVFDFFSFSACSKTVEDISDIVGSYFDQGKRIDLVLIDYWGQLAVPKGYERVSLHEQVTKQAVDLKNMCMKYGTACVIADQATIRTTEAGATSDDLLTESSYTGSQNKVTYTASCINSSVQKEDRKDGTIKTHVTVSRYGYGETQNDGYILTTCPVATGRFADESFHVTSAHIEEIEKFKKENGLSEEKKTRRRR